MASIERIRALLAATTAQLTAELAALDDEDATFHKAPGEWCAKEVVGHLIEADQRGFAGRVTQILATDRPRMTSWDQAAVAAERRDCHRPWQQILDDFIEGRAAGTRVLDGLTEADLGRVGLHPDVGELSIGDVIHEWPFHDRDHMRQLLENTRALLWPGLGGAQRFTALHGGTPP